MPPCSSLPGEWESFFPYLLWWFVIGTHFASFSSPKLKWVHSLLLQSQNKTHRYWVAHISSMHSHSGSSSFSSSFSLSHASVTILYLNLQNRRDFLSCPLNNVKIHSSTVSRPLERNWVVFIPVPGPSTCLQLHSCSSVSDEIFQNHVRQRDIYASPGNASPLLQTEVSQKS